jgi:aryl-alcohol dehydrogenase-like predicted oxidoreductase
VQRRCRLHALRNVLTGKYLGGGEAVPGRASGTLGQERVRPAVAAAAALASLAARVGATPAALALAFPLTNPSVASVLFWATSAAQLRANRAAADVAGRLTAAELDDLRAIRA